MSKSSWWLAGIVLVIGSASAAETTSFRYDALGRLVTSFKRDGPSAGLANRVQYDAADNRVSQSISVLTWRLNPGQTMLSPDGRFTLGMQGDGNLVLYFAGSALWATATFGSGNYATFQTDGNLVVYSAANAPLWGSGTAGNWAARFQMQNDGNMVIMSDADVVLWASNTGGH